jgi:hypothetical protein
MKSPSRLLLIMMHGDHLKILGKKIRRKNADANWR